MFLWSAFKIKKGPLSGRDRRPRPQRSVTTFLGVPFQASRISIVCASFKRRLWSGTGGLRTCLLPLALQFQKSALSCVLFLSDVCGEFRQTRPRPILAKITFTVEGKDVLIRTARL